MLLIEESSATGARISPVVLIQFPAYVGRDPSCSVRIERSGVWQKHVRIDLDAAEGFVVSLCDGSIATLNGVPFQRSRLRQGDQLDLGSARIHVWLSPVRRKSFIGSEVIVWSALGLLALLEVALIRLLF